MSSQTISFAQLQAMSPAELLAFHKQDDEQGDFYRLEYGNLLAQALEKALAAPSSSLLGEGPQDEALENLLKWAERAHKGPYHVEINGERRRWFMTNGGGNVLRSLMSEYDLHELKPDAADRARATDTYMAAADPQTITAIINELLALRAKDAAPALLSSGGPAAELFAGLDLPLIDGESPITFIRRHGPGLTESNGKAYHAALDRIEKILAAPASTSLGGGAAAYDLGIQDFSRYKYNYKTTVHYSPSLKKWVLYSELRKHDGDNTGHTVVATDEQVRESGFFFWQFGGAQPSDLKQVADMAAEWVRSQPKPGEAADQLLVDSSGAGNWISVKERLPEMGVEVQLYYGCQLGKGRQTIGKFADVGVNDWGSEPQNVWLNNYEPTHWKPLDPAPADHD